MGVRKHLHTLGQSDSWYIGTTCRVLCTSISWCACMHFVTASKSSCERDILTVPTAPGAHARHPHLCAFELLFFWQGRTQAVEALLQVGADLTAVAARGTTALHAASYYGHLESVIIM